MSKCYSNCIFFLVAEGVLRGTLSDVTRQLQQLYVNVWQTGPVKIKQCTETVAYHYSLHMLQQSTAVEAICTKKPDRFQLIINAVQEIKLTYEIKVDLHITEPIFH